MTESIEQDTQELPDENQPETEIANIIRDTQDAYDGDYDIESVYELMVRAFLLGVKWERKRYELSKEAGEA